MPRKSLFLTSLCLLLLSGSLAHWPSSPVHARTHAAVVVTWFTPELWPREQVTALVTRFNQTHPDIELQTYTNNAYSWTKLFEVMVFSGQPPDLVGPLHSVLSNRYIDQWLDLHPYVERFDYNLDRFAERAIRLSETDNKLIGLPLVIHPSLIYYNRDLFDEAGLAYPPRAFGEKYILDGQAVAWNWDTVAEIARRLTFDADFNDARSPNFDPNHIVLYGFINQWGTMRGEFSVFGGASFADPLTGQVIIPDPWRAATQWIWDGVWKDHFIPSSAALEAMNDLNAFSGGAVAMARTMTWFMCCLDRAHFAWDIAPVPMYRNQYFAPTDIELFHLVRGSAHPEAAFEVLQFLLSQPEVLDMNGFLSSQVAMQDIFIQAMARKFPSVTNWDIIPESVGYAVIPSHDAFYPGGYGGFDFEGRGQRRFVEFRDLLYGDSGAHIDPAQELDKLQADLQIIVQDALATPMPDSGQ